MEFLKLIFQETLRWIEGMLIAKSIDGDEVVAFISGMLLIILLIFAWI